MHSRPQSGHRSSHPHHTTTPAGPAELMADGGGGNPLKTRGEKKRSLGVFSPREETPTAPRQPQPCPTSLLSPTHPPSTAMGQRLCGDATSSVQRGLEPQGCTGTHMDPHRHIWAHMESHRPTGTYLDPHGPVGTHLDPDGSA